ncbi:UNVERIFIED_CONTAM: gtpbp10 [Trichonephila clavipes]
MHLFLLGYKWLFKCAFVCVCEFFRRFQILGSPGDDVVIDCPPGVTAVANNYVIGELNQIGDKLLLVRGGCGGGPQNGFIGQKGQSVPLTLDLKLLADVGFVG